MEQLDMKNETKPLKSIEDVFSAKNQSSMIRNSNRLTILNPIQPGGVVRQGKPARQGERLCKGPPGRPRSPGLFPEHPPDKGAVADKVSMPLCLLKGRTLSLSKGINTKQTFYNTQKLNFYSHLKFTNMKKQILFLAFFILAILASTIDSFGQLGPATKAILPLSCLATSEPLHPFPGVPYIYSLDGASGAEKASSYTWWATKDKEFITGPVTVATMAGTNFAGRLVSPDLVAPLGTTYGVTTPAATAGSNQVSIIWSAGILAGTDYQGLPGPGTPTFVVGYAEGENCADNIQVFEINPMPNFTVDIAPINPADNTTALPWDDATGELCVDVVQSAKYNDTDKGLDMDYGTNTIYFEVTAANFVTNWTPHFTIEDGLRTSQTAVISLYPTLLDAKGSTNILGTASGDLANGGVWDPTVSLTATVPADAATGVSVFVKVVISNNQEESLTDNPFILAVDGQDNTLAGVATSTSIWDMEEEDCSTLIDGKDEEDTATITVTPRPQLDDTTTPETLPNPDAPIIKTL